MKFIKRVALLLCFCLLFTGCSAVSSMIGTLSVDVDAVTSLEITNSSGKTFTVQDQDDLRKVVDYINVLRLEKETDFPDGSAYTIRLKGADVTISILNADTVSYDGNAYAVNADSLLYYVQKLECETMTDKQLIKQIFEVEYAVFSDLTDAEGNFSLDKFLKLKDKCPASFELISRSSAIPSLSSYGLDLLKQYMASDNNVLRQRAEDIAAFLKAQFPTLASDVENIVEEN